MRDLIEYEGISDIVPENSKCYKILNIQETLHLPSSFPLIDSICKFATNPSILSISIKETPCSFSSTGQRLTGKNVHFHGILKNSVEYSSTESLYDINIFDFSYEFCDYIVLPDDYIESPFSLVAYVHYCNIIKINEHNFFYNVCLSLNIE